MNDKPGYVKGRCRHCGEPVQSDFREWPTVMGVVLCCDQCKEEGPSEFHLNVVEDRTGFDLIICRCSKCRKVMDKTRVEKHSSVCDECDGCAPSVPDEVRNAIKILEEWNKR